MTKITQADTVPRIPKDVMLHEHLDLACDDCGVSEVKPMVVYFYDVPNPEYTFDQYCLKCHMAHNLSKDIKGMDKID